MVHVPEPVNEPVLSYALGTPERAAFEAEHARQKQSPEKFPLVIGGEDVFEGEPRKITSPHDHSLLLGEQAVATQQHVARAIGAAGAARSEWAAKSYEERAAVFLRAADLLAGPWRQRLNAATTLGQSKTPHQAEIDAACELIDFWRFNVHFGAHLTDQQPISTRGTWNRLELRPLDGFVYAITPFNFTAIAGNLPTAPALMGNTVVWKPSPHAVGAAHHVMQLLRAAGLPDGVINLVYGDAAAITKQLLAHPDFAGLHFTGSTAILRQLFGQVAQNMESYRCYPRIVGESGGKDFIVAHPSADIDRLVVAIVRGGYEFQGQKCSAASRLYIPKSLWPRLEKRLKEEIAKIGVGDPADTKNFMGAVIAQHAYERITGYIDLAKKECRIVAGGDAKRDQGWFVWPTLVEASDPKHRLMAEEIFGPVVTAYVYEDGRFEEVLGLCDETSPYALTGAIFADDRGAVELATRTLSHAAGNFYVNDKPTGSVVGQQPFGGARLSGTNDKAGSPWNLLRWASPRAIKESFDAPTDWRYPFMT